MESVEIGNSNWLWFAVFAAKTIALLDPIDSRRDFLASVSGSFEEIDFEHKWLFDLEVGCAGYSNVSFGDRVKLIKLLLDKLISLPWMKKLVDLCCDARVHISSELSQIEKDERKVSQKISLCQRLQSLIDDIPAGDVSAPTIPTVPLTEEELRSEITLRDLLVRAKRSANIFVEKQLPLRLEIVGRDRHNNEYFQVSSARQVVFVRQRSVTHPNVIRYGMYDSLADMEALIQSLDDRGVREHALKTEVQKIKANVYAELVSKGSENFAATSTDWLGGSRQESAVHAIDVGSSAESQAMLGPLRECLVAAQTGLDAIRKTWLGYSGRSGSSSPMEDDMTVDENMDEEEAVSEVTVDGRGTPDIVEFATEKEAFFNALLGLANVFTECIARSMIGVVKIDETPSTCGSILVQFHIKSGLDLFRQVGLPVTQADCDRMIGTDGPYTAFLDGLLALDEIVHDEFSRLAEPVEVWNSNGGEKHAWKNFLQLREHADRDVVEPTDEPIESDNPVEEIEETSTGSFQCETCHKQFKFHIILGIHKLHPCKTRGRKPIPTEPTMDTTPIPGSAGMTAVDKMTLPSFPPPPSSRQQQEEGPVKEANTSGTYICDICGKSFPHNQGLAVHQTRWCIPEQQAQLILTAQQAVGGMPIDATAPVNCEVCGKGFPTAQGLAIHQTRWCRGTEETKSMDDSMGIKKEPVEMKVATVMQVTGPVFVSPPIPSEQLLPIESDEARDPALDRDPGYTPAGFTMGGIAVAAAWYASKIKTAIGKFTSERVHTSRHKNVPKRK